ncbi:MAG: TonB-dependent receptor [Vicinamibacterales bacterium]
MIRRVIGILALAVGLAPAVAFTQSATGTVRGTVRDASTSFIPGATVRVVPDGGGATLEAVSDGEGRYAVTVAAPGSYRIEVGLEGFDAAVRQVAVAPGAVVEVDVALSVARLTEGVVVTARRVEEAVQDVPIPVSVIGEELAARSNAFNVGRIQELVPAVQFYSTNPRNTAINIRGLGSPFGLTNDGIEPGVGLYVDGVFYARPAAATLDFIDLQQIEVLRGPQGTLFGKNTTAGAINVTTRRPTFSPETDVELNVGNIGFVQAKASVSGPIAGALAGRISFSGTQRDGTIFNVATRDDLNTMNNLGVRGQLLYAPSENLAVTFAADGTRQRPEGFTQVVAGVTPTLRAANRQWAQIAQDLGYAPPSYNAFDRVTDVDSPIRSNQNMGGSFLTIDWGVGPGRLSSTTAWRYWDWDPSNDRDFIGLAVTPVSAAPSRQGQWTQEVRYAGRASETVAVTTGLFLFRQSIDSAPASRQEQGAVAARVLLAPSALAATPGLFDGYGMTQQVLFDNLSAAAFGQAEWQVSTRLRLLPGLRLNYDDKSVAFIQRVYGGLQTSDPALVALQRSVLAPQAYAAATDDVNLSGQLTAAYQLGAPVNVYATYATSFKSVGLNLAGVPNDASGQPSIAAAVVKPEHVRHVEIGIKSEPRPGAVANVTFYDTSIRDYQAQVVNAQVGVLRGYLANAEQVGVRGLEFDGSVRVGTGLTLNTSVVFADAQYVRFTDAPPPLEETGGVAVKDISGGRLPGISRWAMTAGGEYARPRRVFGRSGEVFGGVDVSYRTSFSSSPSPSRYLVVDGYALVNTRLGFRAADSWTLSLWARNLLDKDYFELLSAVGGNSGLYVGQPGDFRTFGVTLRISAGRH